MLLPKASHDVAASKKTVFQFSPLLRPVCFQSLLRLGLHGLSDGTTGGDWCLAIGHYLSHVYNFQYYWSEKHVVKKLGARNSIILAMMLYCIYVGCFIVATSIEFLAAPTAILGASVGGVGGGYLWTAQGVYFLQAAEQYAKQSGKECSEVTSYMAGIFACIYLAIEAMLELLPTILIQAGIVSWTTIFGVYSVIAFLAMVGMLWVQDYPPTDSTSSTENVSIWYKVLAAWHLLYDDPKMRYMIGVNAAFGFSGAFVHSFGNGGVVRIVLHDDQSKYVGALSAWSAIVSSFMSLVFERLSRSYGNGSVQILGSMAYLCIVLPFLLLPDLEHQWGWRLLLLVYFMYGAGRATFEGSLRAIFADFFAYEREGAYSNIVLQSGLTSTVGFIVTYSGLECKSSSPYCISYNDGTHHNVLILELGVVITSILAIFGYLRAAQIFKDEQERKEGDVTEKI